MGVKTKEEQQGVISRNIPIFDASNTISTHINRSMFCRQAIALAVNIKNHFERVLNQQMDRTVVTQILLPCRMVDTSQHVLENACTCLASLNDILTCESEGGTSKSYRACGDCGYKVTFIDYDEYLRTIRGTAKSAKRRNSVSSVNTRKRARADNPSNSDAKKVKASDDNYDAYEPMRRMYEAVELQRSERPVRATRSTVASAVTSQLDSAAACDYESDSALLLGMKKDCRVRSLSQETGDSSQQMQEEHGMNGYESASSSSDQSTHSAYFASSFAAPSERNLDINAYTMPLRDTYLQAPLHIATSPYRSGDLTTGAYLLTRCASPDTNLDYTYPAPELHEPGSHYATAGGEDSVCAGSPGDPSDGAALRDFLAACYRDGMYPSPIAPGDSGAAAHGACRVPTVVHSSGSSGRGSPTPSMIVLTGQGDADFPCFSCASWPSRDASEAMPYSCAGDHEVLVRTVGQSVQPLGGSSFVNTTSSTDTSSSSSADGAVAFAYEELQQLLTHLLHEHSSNKD